MDNDNNATPQDIYGEGVVLGNADSVQQDVSVVSSTNSQIQLETGETTDVEPQDTDEPQQEPVDNVQKSDDDVLNDNIAKSEKTIQALGEDLGKRGVDFNRVLQEYEDYGELTETTMKSLEKAGYPKEIIEGFVSSREALAQQYTNSVYSYAGGKENFDNLIQWASNSLAESEIDAFNEAIDSGNLSVVKLMLEGIQAKRQAIYGTRKPSLMGNTASQSQVKGFADRNELVKAMSDPRYGVDARYTHSIEQRMLKTQLY